MLQKSGKKNYKKKTDIPSGNTEFLLLFQFDLRNVYFSFLYKSIMFNPSSIITIICLFYSLSSLYITQFICLGLLVFFISNCFFYLSSLSFIFPLMFYLSFFFILLLHTYTHKISLSLSISLQHYLTLFLHQILCAS